MFKSEDVPGDLHQCHDPVWSPLVELIGSELAEWLMWMCEIELADRTRVHAYKHRSTRRYLHLADDGRAFTFTAAAEYRAITRAHAVEQAFVGWEHLLPQPENPASVRAALRRACATADKR